MERTREPKYDVKRIAVRLWLELIPFNRRVNLVQHGSVDTVTIDDGRGTCKH